MGDVALIQVVGRLTKDAEAEALQNNADRVTIKFTVASNYYEKGKDQRPAAFYEARMFMPRDRFNNVSQFLRKGAAVLLYGQLRPRETQDANGQKKTWLNVEECDFAPLEAPKAGAQPVAAGPAAAPAPSQYVTDPKYPGYYFDRQTNQWVQGAVPQPAPPAPAPAPYQPPAPAPAPYQPPAAPPAAPPGWNPGGAPSAPPAAAPPASGGASYGGPPPGQSPI